MPYINTDRLTLVTFTVEMMKATLIGQNQLGKITDYKAADEYPLEDYKQLLSYKIDRFTQYPEENEWEGIIIHKKDNTIMGDMGFKGGPNEKGEMDLGYSIVPSYQGEGYATEMTIAMVNWGLQQQNVNKITASCSESNIPSIRVLEKTGFEQIRTEDKEIYWSI
ncbi:Acetyltransferase (GNAT) domain-containing protein [Virgibacillus subterraneus]|uniref:Acetyltransferase (GNAT) domain-containing protein n=2 Tax=Virgibacillus TaxID=84406 RepID=A0A1H1DRK1_9BACI|nr:MULTISPECIES: GNAT family N-acetyltransferase [Virgibacillus]SDQ79135.1 Acetyltransferase (GNAT) domain-containing protein [Virgibacillus salinus]SEQ89669.1 Acetyltransferase (GNAT) domain-containing protein [Virgibacillus subterraneus]